MRDYEDKREGRQIIFGWIFVVSSIVLIVSVFISILFLTLSKSEGSLAAMSVSGLIPVLALLVSLSSLIGFVLNWILSIKKERRETQTFKLELEKKALEIEQLRMQLGRARAISSTAQEKANEPM